MKLWLEYPYRNYLHTSTYYLISPTKALFFQYEIQNGYLIYDIYRTLTNEVQPSAKISAVSIACAHVINSDTSKIKDDHNTRTMTIEDAREMWLGTLDQGYRRVKMIKFDPDASPDEFIVLYDDD